MTDVAILLDGGHFRHLTKKSGLEPTPDLVEDFAHAILEEDERLFRVLYYDCRPYNGRQRKPVSGEEMEFSLYAGWMDEIGRRDFFALRLGHLKFRGWQLRDDAIGDEGDLTDEDFVPVFEQKGVEIKMGLDIARFAETKAVRRLLVVSGDTDLVPALQHARTAGLQVSMIQPPGWQLHDLLKMHADQCRDVGWPEGAASRR
ncbi:MAG: NYN domain-containing protein [Pseudomonadota bacterium]